MKTMQVLKMKCCTEENKCKECVPVWSLNYFLEIDSECVGNDKYTVLFPLLGFDEQMRSKIKNFFPLVGADGVWYLRHHEALKIYKNTDRAEGLKKVVDSLIKKYEEKINEENKE